MTMILYCCLGILFFAIFATGSDATRFNGAMSNRIHHAQAFYRFPSTSFEHCYRLCIYAKSCESSNWLSTTGECQLNLRDPDSSGSTEFSTGSVHVSSFQVGIQRNPCSDGPCSSDHMCVPVTKGMDYRCLRIFKNVERQPDTSSLSSEEISTTPLTTDSETSASSSTSTEATTPSPSTASPPTAAATSSQTSSSSSFTTSPSMTSSLSTATTSQTTTSTTTTPSATTPIATQPSPSTTATSSTSAFSTSTSVSSSTSTTTTTTLPSTDCTVTAECSPFPDTICIDKTCACAIGFDLDRESGGCRSMKECAVFGTNFTCYQGHYITETNQETHNGDQSYCEQKCLASTSFTCKSYETYISNCYLQSVTWADVSADLRVTGGIAVQHCQRNCEWT